VVVAGASVDALQLYTLYYDYYVPPVIITSTY